MGTAQLAIYLAILLVIVGIAIWIYKSGGDNAKKNALKEKVKATKAFKKLPPKLKPWKRHAFVGIGWIRVEKTRPLNPSIV